MSEFQVFVDETKNEIIVNEETQTVIIKDVGIQGQDGQGVPTGGSTDQYLKKQSGDDYDTAWATINSDEISEGVINQFYTDERVDDRVNSLIVEGNGIDKVYDDNAGSLTISVDQSEIDHVNLANVGTNSHSDIDDHIADTNNPHSVTAAQAGAVALTGNETVGGVKTFTSYPVGPASVPTLPDELVDKAYVDSVAATNLSWKSACEACSTSDIDLTNPATSSFDGHTILVGERVLIKSQADAKENGIYIFNGAASAMTRATDADVSVELQAATVAINFGTTCGNKVFKQNTENPTLGVDDILFIELFSNVISADGQGIELSLNTLSLELDGSTLSKSATGLKVTDGGIGNTQLGSITAAGKISGSALTSLSSTPSGAGALPVANGGTNITSYATGDLLYASSPTALTKLNAGVDGQYLSLSSGLPTWSAIAGGGPVTLEYTKPLNVDITPVTVTNTATETTIYSYSLAGGTLGTNKVIRGLLSGTYQNNSGGTRTVTVRVKYGATTILQKASAAIATNAGTGSFQIDFNLYAQGSASVQQAWMACSFESGANVSVNFDDRGVAAINSAANQTLTVTVQFSAATATQTLVRRHCLLALLNASDLVGGPSLSTDGVLNGTQTALNLEAGTNITLTDDGLGTVTIDSSGGGGVTIGDPVVGGISGEIIYTDNSGNVYSDESFTRDSVTNFTNISSLISASVGSDNDPNSFLVSAVNAGDAGNSISLVFDGIDDVDTVVAAWNAANPSNQVVVDGGGTSVPTALTYTLSGGGGITAFVGEALGGDISGGGFLAQDTTNNINMVTAVGNLNGLFGIPHAVASLVQESVNNFISIMLQQPTATQLTTIDLNGFTYFSNIYAADDRASISFIDNTTNCGFFAEPANKTYIRVNSNDYIWPTSSGSINDVLAITGQAGSEFTLDWTAPSGGASPAGSVYEVQFNSGGGTLAATSNFSYDTSTNLIKILSNNGLNIDPTNNEYNFGNLGVGQSTSYFTHSDITNQMDYIGGVPIFGTIGASITSGPNDLSYVQTGYTSRADKTWTIEIDNAPVESGTIFTGVGLDDAVFSGTFLGTTNEIITVTIDSTGGTDTFEWFLNGVSQSTNVPITGSAQSLLTGISITFGATTGHTSGDSWRVGNGFGAVEFAATSFIGTFQQYETVTGSISGATATLGYDRSISSQVILTNISAGGFVVNDVLTGGTSGAVATITALTGINDTFEWNDGGSPFPQTPINANNALYTLSDGVDIMWGSTSGHGLGSTWNFSANLTNIVKQRFSNTTSDNSITIGDVEDTLNPLVPNYFKIDLLSRTTSLSCNQIQMGDITGAQNATGWVMSDTDQTMLFYAPSVCTIGDINNANGGLIFTSSSIEGTFEVNTGGVSGDSYFYIDQPNGLYNLGDFSGSLNSNSLRINDVANTVRIGNGSNDIIVDGLDSRVTLPNGLIYSKVTVVTYGSTTSLTSADYDIEVDGSSGATTINLPTGGTSPIGTVYIISDLGANCSVDNITIDAGASNFIVGGTSAQTYIMNSNGQVVKLKKVTATKWKVQ
jgi:hypothetical protein